MGETIFSTSDDQTATEVFNRPTLTNIQSFYAGKTIFVTGGTGFVGKLVIEKLLRTCSDLKIIYVLIRPKKGKDIQTRLEEMFEYVVFDRLKRENPNYLTQVRLIAGDCGESNLDLSHDDRQRLIEEVNCVIHLAATVRFDEKLRTAVNINVRGTRDLMKLAREMNQLQSLVYVSTAFSFCTREEIDDVVYDSTILPGEKLMSVIDPLDDDVLNAITPILLGKWPNTYTYSKAIAEGVVLPVAIVRPSMITNTAKEPVSGWIDNFYGPLGLSTAISLGLVRTVCFHIEKKCDMVPGDYVVNCILATGWETARTRSMSKEVTVHNIVSTPHENMTWGRFQDLVEKKGKLYPSVMQVWYHLYFINRSKLMNSICLFLMHTIPSYIIDFVLFCLRRETIAVKGYQKIKKLVGLTIYFSTREWKFRDNNTRSLWKSLTEDDRRLFNFDLSSLDFEEYYGNCVKGVRVYLLKDPLDTVPQGRAKYRKLKIAHAIFCTVFFYLLYLLFSFMARLIFY